MPQIIDSHVHFFDPTRPGGVPWPTADTPALYKPALPPRLENLSRPFGIAGCIAIECSPLLTDNDWLLKVAESDPFVLGIIGDLDPADPAYRSQLDRLHSNPLFLGIRYGNLWNRDLLADLEKPHFIDGLKTLSEAGLVFESANPDPRLIRALLRIADALPRLRIVIDHLPNARVIADPNTVAIYRHNLADLAQHPQVYVKLSEIPTIKDGVLIRDKQYYREKLDPLWNLFGPDRVIFGSDWPNSDQIAPYDRPSQSSLNTSRRNRPLLPKPTSGKTPKPPFDGLPALPSSPDSKLSAISLLACEATQSPKSASFFAPRSGARVIRVG